jgi:transcriptional regulator with XRE-family HTH domain
MRPSRNELLIRAFSAAIKSRRLEIELTQEDLAGRIEIDRPYITALEAGTKQPTISVLWRIALGLDLTVSQLSELVDKRLVRLGPSDRKVAAAKKVTPENKAR